MSADERPWIVALRSVGSDELEIAVYDVIGRSFLSGDGIVAKDVLNRLRSAPNARKISLRINSVGGVVDEAKAMVNLLSERSAKGVQIEATVDGLAASAASYLRTAATKVIMPANAFQMIHGVRAGVRGTASEIAAAAVLMERMNHQLATAYAAASARRGKGKTKEDFLAAFAAGDLYLDADEAIEWGLADQKTASLQVAACLADISTLDSAPAAIRTAVYVTATAAQPPRTQTKERRPKMDQAEIKALYPDAYSVILDAGIALERKRVKSHLKMGQNAGAAVFALACIESGASLQDDDVFAEYTSAAINHRDVSNRQADSDFAGAIFASAKSSDGAPVGAQGESLASAEVPGEDSKLLVAVADLYTGKRSA